MPGTQDEIIARLRDRLRQQNSGTRMAGPPMGYGQPMMGFNPYSSWGGYGGPSMGGMSGGFGGMYGSMMGGNPYDAYFRSMQQPQQPQTRLSDIAPNGLQNWFNNHGTGGYAPQQSASVGQQQPQQHRGMVENNVQSYGGGSQTYYTPRPQPPQQPQQPQQPAPQAQRQATSQYAPTSTYSQQPRQSAAPVQNRLQSRIQRPAPRY